MNLSGCTTHPCEKLIHQIRNEFCGRRYEYTAISIENAFPALPECSGFLNGQIGYDPVEPL